MATSSSPSSKDSHASSSSEEKNTAFQANSPSDGNININPVCNPPPTQAQLSSGESTAAVTVPGGGSSSEGAGTAGRMRKKRRIHRGVPAEHTCQLFLKKFRSEKALDGHLKAHPDSQWSGRFPPPKGGHELPAGADSRELLEQGSASTSMEIAEHTLTKRRAGSKRGLAKLLDLNSYPSEDEDEAGDGDE